MLFKVNNIVDQIYEYFDFLKDKTYKQTMWNNGVVYLYGMLEPNEESKTLEYRYINGYHCFLGSSQNKHKYLVAPLHDSKLFIDYTDLCSLLNYLISSYIPYKTDSMFTVCTPDLLRDIKKDNKFVWHKYFSDFIFERQSVINMSGRCWQNKRSLIHKFKREHPSAKFRLANINDINGIDKVYDMWSKHKQLMGWKLHSEKTFHKEIEFIFSDFGKRMSSMYVCEENNNILGYVSFGQLCKDTMQTLRRNTVISEEYKGLSECLFYEGLKMFDSDAHFVNDGNGGSSKHPLYFWKMHYNPVDFIDTGYVSLK